MIIACAPGKVKDRRREAGIVGMCAGESEVRSQKCFAREGRRHATPGAGLLTSDFSTQTTFGLSTSGFSEVRSSMRTDSPLRELLRAAMPMRIDITPSRALAAW